jgi:hypothetical protein
MNQSGEIKHHFGVNISHKNNTFLWLWDKCGTTHMKTVLDRFDFKYYVLKDEKLLLSNTSIVQEHSCIIFPEHNNYKLLAAIRNPYAKFFSEFVSVNKIGKSKKIEFSQENRGRFITHIESRFMMGLKLSNNCCDFLDRKPDYAVRLENLYEDYSKIPFIVESKYYKSGELKKATTQKVNVSNEDVTLWKKFYTQEIADIVYYRMPRYFDLFGYDKNSWKK